MKASVVPSLREKQVEMTRELILRAVAERLEREAPGEISVADIAKESGASLRTVYRYFPTRDELLAASADWINERIFGGMPYAETLDALMAELPETFERFGEHPELVRTMALTETGRSVRAKRREQRLARMREALEDVTGRLPRHERRQAEAVIGSLYDMGTWVSMHDEAGLSGRDAGEAVAWAIQTLIEDLRRRSEGRTDAR